MRSMNRILFLAGCIIFFSLSSLAYGATITGTVKGPDGAPFEGVFVAAQNTKNYITVFVLSDKSGHYRVENLSAGDYDLRTKAIGYKEEQHKGVNLTASQNASFDFALQKGVVRWADLSIDQGVQLFPDGTGKKEYDARCLGCHGFQSREASVQRDADGWRDRVNYMRYVMRLGGLTDEGWSNVAVYVNSLFGNDSVLPPSPADLPAYKNLEQHFTDDAMKIVYVEYRLPGLGRMPWDVNPGKNGKLWIPYYSQLNMVAQLDPITGDVKEFPLPPQPRVGMHSAVEAPDGNVWFTEQANNTLGKLDPATGKVTEYHDEHISGTIRPTSRTMYDSDASRNGVSKHTVRVDSQGYVWASGTPASRFDPKTGKYDEFKEGAYSVALDQQGNAWLSANNTLVKVDGETLKETEYTPPTHDKNFNRRIVTDTDGMIWFAEFNQNKMTSFDPKTEKFKDYTLPGHNATPYAVGIDKNHNVWYSSQDMDYIGCLDPATGKVLEYPYPHRENAMREFYFDGQGRMWYASPPNNNVGYFTIAK